MFDALFDDIRFGLRTLRRTPALTAAGIATLALGIGLTTAISSVHQSVLLHQLPFQHPERVVSVQLESRDPRGRIGLGLLQEWRTRAADFESFAAYDDSQLLWRGGEGTEVLRGMRVSSNFFRTLEVSVALGRDLAETDDPYSGDAIILTHDLWRRRFGADPAVVGRTLDTDGGPRRIVGVLPAAFHGLRMSNPSEIPRYFAPLPRERADAVECPGCTVRVIARLAPDRTAAAGAAQLSQITRDVAMRDAAVTASSPVHVVPLLDRLVGPVRNALMLVMGAVLCVLLIACGNIASLQIVRATARTRELATRAALGASRARIGSQLLVENLLLASLGGGLGIILGRVGTGALAAWAPAETPRVDEIHMNVQVLLFACGISLATGLLFGLAPLAASARTDVNAVLKHTSRAGGRPGSHRLRSALVVADLALAFTLVMMTTLLGRSLGNLRAVDAGFDPRGVLTLTPVASSGGPARTVDGRMAYNTTLIQRVAAVPGVSAVGMVSNVPLSNVEPVRVVTDLDIGGDAREDSALFIIGGRYLEALRIPIVAGRGFDDRENAPRRTPVVLVSASFAAHHFGESDPLRHRIRFDSRSEWCQIAGVVGDVRYGQLDEGPGDAIYVPQSWYPQHYARLVARTSGDPNAFAAAIVSAIREVDPDQGIFHVQAMDDYVSSALAGRRLPVNLLTFLGIVALLLSAVGLYGVLGFAVLQRTREIGIRRALGASERHILVLVGRHASVVMLLGLVAGGATAWIVTRVIGSWLFGVARSDPWTIAASIAILAGVSAAGAAFPALHAIRIEPTVALRSE